MTEPSVQHLRPIVADVAHQGIARRCPHRVGVIGTQQVRRGRAAIVPAQPLLPIPLVENHRIRSWIGAMISFASVVTMAKLWSHSPVGSFQASQRPAKAIGEPDVSETAKGCFAALGARSSLFHS